VTLKLADTSVVKCQPSVPYRANFYILVPFLSPDQQW